VPDNSSLDKQLKRIDQLRARVAQLQIEKQRADAEMRRKLVEADYVIEDALGMLSMMAQYDPLRAMILVPFWPLLKFLQFLVRKALR
jgi:hypothetical protein